MNRIAGRSRFVLILAAVLVLGLVIFSGEYLLQAKEWVVFPGSPHVYRGSNLNCGVVTDRTGAVLLDATDGRTYSDDRTVRLATLHLLGDREGYISAPAVSEYSRLWCAWGHLWSAPAITSRSPLPKLSTVTSRDARTVADPPPEDH